MTRHTLSTLQRDGLPNGKACPIHCPATRPPQPRDVLRPLRANWAKPLNNDLKTDSALLHDPRLGRSRRGSVYSSEYYPSPATTSPTYGALEDTANTKANRPHPQSGFAGSRHRIWLKRSPSRVTRSLLRPPQRPSPLPLATLRPVTTKCPDRPGQPALTQSRLSSATLQLLALACLMGSPTWQRDTATTWRPPLLRFFLGLLAATPRLWGWASRTHAPVPATRAATMPRRRLLPPHTAHQRIYRQLCPS